MCAWFLAQSAIFRFLNSIFSWGVWLPVLILSSTPFGDLKWFKLHHVAILASVISSSFLLVSMPSSWSVLRLLFLPEISSAWLKWLFFSEAFNRKISFDNLFFQRANFPCSVWGVGISQITLAQELFSQSSFVAGDLSTASYFETPSIKVLVLE